MRGPMSIGPIFDEAIEKVFNHWTILSLAVDQAWGGRESKNKRYALQAEVCEILATGAKKKRPPIYTNESDVRELADYLLQRVDELFNAEADDGSDMEVAGVVLRIFNTCSAGDPTYAQQFIASLPTAPVDHSKSKGQEDIQYATEEDELLDGLAGMDLDGADGIDEGDEEDMDDDDADKGGAPGGYLGAKPVEAGGAFSANVEAQQEQHQRKPPPPEPEVDEDGFTSIVKGKRRGR